MNPIGARGRTLKVCLPRFLLLSLITPAHGAESVQTLIVHGSTLTLHIAPTLSAELDSAIEQWIQTSAEGVSRFYGYFPVKTVQIYVQVGEGDDMDHGVTYQGNRIRIDVGRHTSRDQFTKDWEMTHEMFHLGFPILDDDYQWMGEGLSDYLEPLARVANGTMLENDFWRQFLGGFPKGLPQAGDRGLNDTHTWGRTYWGGALYWFLADVEIHRRTQNKHSLHDAVLAILNAGGNGRAECVEPVQFLQPFCCRHRDREG